MTSFEENLKEFQVLSLLSYHSSCMVGCGVAPQGPVAASPRPPSSRQQKAAKRNQGGIKKQEKSPQDATKGGTPSLNIALWE